MEDQHDNFNKEIQTSGTSGTFSNRSGKWVTRIGGGLAGGVITFVILVLPTVNTLIANARDISMAQIKENANNIAVVREQTDRQIAYITKRMEDSDKERDLYKAEMLACQKELRGLKNR